MNLKKKIKPKYEIQQQPYLQIYKHLNESYYQELVFLVNERAERKLN